MRGSNVRRARNSCLFPDEAPAHCQRNAFIQCPSPPLLAFPRPSDGGQGRRARAIGEGRGTGSNFGAVKWLALLCGLFFISGCALHYYDKKSGTEHLWGLGHMKMKAAPPNEGVQAVVKGTEMLGFHIGAGQEEYHIGLGWDYRRRIVISSNATVRLEWPNGDFFNVRVGTAPPFATNSSVSKNKGNP